jgi:hypothetical protein
VLLNWVPLITTLFDLHEAERKRTLLESAYEASVTFIPKPEKHTTTTTREL